MSNQRRDNRNFRWQKSNRSSNYISTSACGLLFTVDGDDKRAVREAYNVIDIFIPKEEVIASSSIANETESTEKQVDVSDALTKMCAETTAKPHVGSFRPSGIRQLDTGVKHTLFFTSPGIITTENVYSIVDAMVEDCQKNSRCRFLARVLPVEDTCVGDVSALRGHVQRLIAKHLDATKAEFGERAPSYAVDYRSRNSDLLDRQPMIDIVTDVMQVLSPESRVNLTQPDLLVMVNILRKSVMLSCVRNYAARNKFSIRVTNKDSTDKVNGEDEKADAVSSSKETVGSNGDSGEVPPTASE